VAVARHLVGEYKDGVHFVELASVSDPALVPSAVATALGLPIWSEASILGVVEFVRDKHILIVLDNCEHVLDAASELTVALLKGGRAHMFSQPAESHFVLTESGFTACQHWPCRLRMRL
jgi:predicted ATPase